MSITEIIEENKWGNCEEIQLSWIICNLAKSYGYSVSVLGGEDVWLDYACFRYLKSHGVSPRYLITSHRNRRTEKEFDGIPCIDWNDYCKLGITDDFALVTRRCASDTAGSRLFYAARLIWHIIKKRGTPRLMSEKSLDTAFKRWSYFILPFLRIECGKMLAFAKQHTIELENLYDALEDDISKETLKAILYGIMNNTRFHYREYESAEKYFGSERDPIYRHLEDEVWLNCGAAMGDTIIRFAQSGLPFHKIYAYEGDPQTAKILTDNLSYLPQRFKENVIIKQEFLGADSHFEAIPTLINMDIEGAELDVLTSLKDLIEIHRPVCAICAYHKAKDLIDIPDFFQNKISGVWHFYLRKYMSFDLNTLNEYVIYAVPEERTVNCKK